QVDGGSGAAGFDQVGHEGAVAAEGGEAEGQAHGGFGDLAVPAFALMAVGKAIPDGVDGDGGGDGEVAAESELFGRRAGGGVDDGFEQGGVPVVELSAVQAETTIGIGAAGDGEQVAAGRHVAAKVGDGGEAGADGGGVEDGAGGFEVFEGTPVELVGAVRVGAAFGQVAEILQADPRAMGQACAVEV